MKHCALAIDEMRGGVLGLFFNIADWKDIWAAS